MQYIRYIRSSGTKLRWPVGNVSVRYLAARCLITIMAANLAQGAFYQTRYCMSCWYVRNAIAVGKKGFVYFGDKYSRFRSLDVSMDTLCNRPGWKGVGEVCYQVCDLIASLNGLDGPHYRMTNLIQSFCGNARHLPRLLCPQELNCPQKMTCTSGAIVS